MCTDQLEFPGYDWAVQERSGNQKEGGGLLSVWRDNTRVKVWLSPHTGKDDWFQNERMWTILVKGSKLAVCNHCYKKGNNVAQTIKKLYKVYICKK